MQSYGVEQVEKLLRMPRATIRALVDAGFVTPARGERNALRFSFQDLIVLRTAQSLVDSKVPQRRIVKALRELRSKLPASMPLSGLSIGAEGERVVVREGRKRWQADSGQYLLAFDGDPEAGTLGVVERKPEVAKAVAEVVETHLAPTDWYAMAVKLESNGEIDSAVRAYGRAIASNQRNADAYLNLGRLLHEIGYLPEAEKIYRVGVKACPEVALLNYNLGVLMEDRKRRPEAIAAYLNALKVDPGLADAHYNVALLYESVGKERDAIRYMANYRKLVR
jgi:tetratricopeptide (TPR) repeat protein